MPTEYKGLGGNSPYQYNILRPSGGANEIGTQYTDLDENVIGETIGSFMDAYQKRKEARKQAAIERQQQALAIAEMQGEVTPELEEAILGPLQPEQPTRGAALVGGLGRLFGIDTQMGQPQEPFRLTGGGLKTKQERELEKEEAKFQQGLAKEKYTSDLETQQKVEQKEKGVFNPTLSYEEQLNLVKERNKGIKARGYANLKPADKLKQDLYDGTKKPEDLTQADFLILGKYWASMTPEAQAEEALSYAEKIATSMTTGTMNKPTEAEMNQLVDRLATDYVDKLNKIIKKSKGKMGMGGRGGTGGTGGRGLNEIMGGY